MTLARLLRQYMVQYINQSQAGFFMILGADFSMSFSLYHLYRGRSGYPKTYGVFFVEAMSLSQLTIQLFTTTKQYYSP